MRGGATAGPWPGSGRAGERCRAGAEDGKRAACRTFRCCRRASQVGCGDCKTARCVAFRARQAENYIFFAGFHLSVS